MSLVDAAFAAELDSICQNYKINLNRVAVGVSGGADSLALIKLLSRYRENNNCQIVALTVNHHLRTEADEEAMYVASLMNEFGVEHHILNWFPENICSGIEEKARNARYQLLFDWCRDNQIDNLLTAHHQKDQAETFLMRLQRGSGVDGLSAISKFSLRSGINLIRPLLDFSPEELRVYLQNEKISWREDASNSCEDFLRVRIRNMLPQLEKGMGLTVKRICDAAKAMGSVKEYFEHEVCAFINSSVQNWQDKAVCFMPEAFLNLHNELKTRVLSQLIRKIGGREYSPTYEELQRLVLNFSNKQFRGCTLGSCEILLFQKKLWIIPEIKNKVVLSRQQWTDFVQVHHEYMGAILPYKLKVILAIGDTI